MQNLRYFLTVIAGAFSAVALAVIFPGLVPVHAPTEVLGAPETQATFQKNLIPMTDSTYTLGTTTKTWLNLYTDEICLAGDCQTTWPAGGAGGGSNWLFDGTNLTPSTTPVGIVVNGTSTISNLNGTLYVDGVAYPKTRDGIQSAITQAESSSGNNTVVHLPCGTFALSNPLVISERVTLEGNGRCTNLNVTTATSGILINATTGAIIGLTLRDLQISGNDSGTYGIHATSTGGYEITGFRGENLHIDGFDTQFYIDVSLGGLCDNCIFEYGHTNSLGIDLHPTGTQRIWMQFNRPWFEGLTTGANIIGNSYVSFMSPHWSTPLTNRYLLNDSEGNHPELSIVGDLGSQFIATGEQNAVVKIHSYNSVDGFGELRFLEGAGTGGSRMGLQYLVSNNSLHVRDYENGVQRVSFSQLGNMGIGSTTPRSKLTIEARPGDTNDVLFQIASSTGSATTTSFYVDASGNAVFNNGVTTLLAHPPTETGTTKIIGTADRQLIIGGSLNSSGETAGIEFRYNDASIGANIASILASTTSGGGGDLLFQTAPSGAGAYTTKMTILRSGFLGIGTTTPSSLFQTFSTGTSTISIDSNSASKGGCIELKDRSGTGYTYITAEDGTLSASTVSCK